MRGCGVDSDTPSISVGGKTSPEQVVPGNYGAPIRPPLQICGGWEAQSKPQPVQFRPPAHEF